MRACAFILVAAGFVVVPGLSASAQQPYPTRPITVVVPFAAGGPTDVLTRILGQHMSLTLGQQIVVENVTGGGGSIGAARVAKATPDGYTMVMGNLGTHAAAVGLYKNLSYNPRVDFEPVMLVASTPMVLVVRKTLATDTLKDFTAYAAAHPHELTFGSAGTGSISHLTYLLYTKLTKTQIQHVPYRGLSQSVNDLLSGQIDLMFDQVVSATPHILAGTVKPIAVTAPKRAAAIPDVPSSVEAGLPELQTIAWTALFFPKGTPQPIVERVNSALDKAMRDESVAKRLAELGADLPADAERSPQALGKLVGDEIDKWVPLIQAAGVVGN
ncbi:MAG TPA: tripartite tricarboxylate transporter substrate-binding protein [Xanthobacteraceae bacterium]|nr:tripartite tricarboxylate transporter substrate-binding protein [Xanthobacteraceae bacterium]